MSLYEKFVKCFNLSNFKKTSKENIQTSEKSVPKDKFERMNYFNNLKLDYIKQKKVSACGHELEFECMCDKITATTSYLSKKM